MAAAKDAGNRSMRAAGRATWNRADYRAAVREYDRLIPRPRRQTTTGAGTVQGYACIIPAPVF
jgi:hypothetical protein